MMARYLDPLSSHNKQQQKNKKRKKIVRVGPPLAKLSGSAHAISKYSKFCFQRPLKIDKTKTLMTNDSF